MEQIEPSKQPDPAEHTEPKVKSIEIQDLLDTCRDAIRDFDLANILAKTKTFHLLELVEFEREKFCAGMIALGEALTFCRHPSKQSKDKKRWEIEQANIAGCANHYASVRNYLVHHIMYGCIQKYEEFCKTVRTLDPIEVLTKKLSMLEEAFKTANDGIPKPYRKETLSKIIVPGENDFQFEYNHIFECLKKEFKELDKILERVKTVKDIDDFARTRLNNRVRNTLTIMLDLLDEPNRNKNLGKDCRELKDAVMNVNTKFITENDEFMQIFKGLQVFRHALCHLDDSLDKPYRNDEELLGFVQRLQKLQEKGYLKELEIGLVAAQKKAAESISLSEPNKSSQVIESSAKKPKQEEHSPSATRTTARGLISVYTTTKDEESIQKNESSKSDRESPERERKPSSGHSFTK